MKKANTKKEADIKIPLILSFVFTIVGIIMSFNEEKFKYWGVVEPVIGVGEEGLLGIVMPLLSLTTMFVVFIIFKESSITHWTVLLIIYGIVGYFSLNMGTAMTNDGIYKREWGKTVQYQYKDIVASKINNKKKMIDTADRYTLYLENGENIVVIKDRVSVAILDKIEKKMLVSNK